MDQEALARLEPTAIEHVGPHREERLGECGRPYGVVALGKGQALRHRRAAIFGVAPAGHQRTDGIADLPACDAIAEGDDLAGDLQARNIGGPRRRSIAPLPLQDVRPIDAGRRHLHQYLAGRRLRRRPLAGREDLRSAGLLDLDGGHGTGMGGGHEWGSLGLATGRAALV